MPIVDFDYLGLSSDRSVERWSKMLAEEALKHRYFAKFIEREPLPKLSLYKRLRYRFLDKWEDVVAGCRIIFNGEYPDEDE